MRDTLKTMPKLPIVVTIAVLCLVTWSCSPAALQRSDYDIIVAGDVIATNSEMTRLHVPKWLASRQCLLKYPFLVQNQNGSKRATVLLSQARVAVPEKPSSFPMTCRVLDAPEAKETGRTPATLDLEPGQKRLLECEAKIEATDENGLQGPKAWAFLEVPVQGAKDPLRFRYRFRIEDFD